MNRSVTFLKSELFKTGGAEKYARALATAFASKGATVRVFTSGPTEPAPFEVISYLPKAKTSFGKLWEYAKAAHKHLEKAPTDIIFGCDRTPLQTHLRAGSGVHRSYLEMRKRCETPLTALRHKCNPLHLSLLGLEKIAFEHADLQKLYVNSHLVKEEIAAHFIVDPSKIEVIHNGVEWNELSTPFANYTSHYTNETYNLLFIGNGYERKGLSPLLHALARLPQKEWQLTVIGKDKKPKRFKALAQTLGIDRQVHFLGPVQDIVPYLQRSDCLVVPSLYDPFANVTVEALAMGLFVISSKTNGGCEVLTPQTGAIIEDLFDKDAFQVALQTALKRPKTPESARSIRESVKSLDFSHTLDRYVESVLC